MKETAVLSNLEQIKVMAHPLRMRLLEAFSCKPMTAKQVAQSLGLQPTKLYHHVDALERVGLIKLVRTKKKRGTLEKYYQAVATRFTVDRKVLQLRPEAKEVIGKLQAMTAAIFEETQSELQHGIAEKLIKPHGQRGEAILMHTHFHTTPEHIEKLKQKIQMLLQECDVAKRKRGDVEYGLTIAFYPVKSKTKTRL